MLFAVFTTVSTVHNYGDQMLQKLGFIWANLLGKTVYVEQRSRKLCNIPTRSVEVAIDARTSTAIKKFLPNLQKVEESITGIRMDAGVEHFKSPAHLPQTRAIVPISWTIFFNYASMVDMIFIM
ncbi:hypothetical protein Fot_28139 [Forsythia ovata]|uniref:Uncharacterized protein n=1 Tax=Forsythia ovata TaxID=205694 RepID=A0ABD1TN60_9LAMI